MTGTDRYILKPEKARLAAQKYMKSYGKADNKYISLSNIGEKCVQPLQFKLQ